MKLLGYDNKKKAKPKTSKQIPWFPLERKLTENINSWKVMNDSADEKCTIQILTIYMDINLRLMKDAALFIPYLKQLVR